MLRTACITPGSAGAVLSWAWRSPRRAA